MKQHDARNGALREAIDHLQAKLDRCGCMRFTRGTHPHPFCIGQRDSIKELKRLIFEIPQG